jgi:hypothetical protein
MQSNLTDISVEGKVLPVPCTHIEDRIVVVRGRWLKVATVRDEDFVEGDSVRDPKRFIAALKAAPLKADLFTFVQKLPDTTPRYGYNFELDNVAALPTTTYDKWWQEQVSHKLRGDVSRAKKRGVIVKTTEFTEEFVRGVMQIYEETPVRQGRPFWHYGKDFETIKRETGTYLERSEFLGAYFNDELIGFMKVTYDGSLARMMQITSKVAHQDKRPTNALIAKAVEVCEAKRCTYLIYGKYTYSRTQSSLAEFKRRNGFQEIKLPRYYVPLTLKGKLAVGLRLHHGVMALLPDWFINLAVRLRAKYFDSEGTKSTSRECTSGSGQDRTANRTTRGE